MEFNLENMDKNRFFPKVIGQDKAKSELSMWLAAKEKTGLMPNFIFYGGKGQGKTHLVQAVANHLKKNDPKTKCITMTSSTIKNLDTLCDQVFMPYLNDSAVFFFDECHLLSTKIVGTLLTVTNPNPSNKTTLNWQGGDLDFDFHKHHFFFATTERHKVFKPLEDRLEKIELVDYDVKEIAQIMGLYFTTNGKKVPMDSLLDFAKFSRQNARSAVSLAKRIEGFCTASDISDIDSGILPLLKKQLTIHPFGLSSNELEALKNLSKNRANGMSLGHLASTVRLNSSACQDLEKYPLSLGLIRIEGKRHITNTGLSLLKEIDGK